MENNDGLSYLFSAISITCAWIEPVTEIANLTAKVIAIVIGLCSLINFVIGWWKKAHKDGKITSNEIEDLTTGVINGANSIKENLKNLTDSKEEKKDESKKD